MHDATECGVWGGLAEVAEASRVGMAVEKGEIIVDERVKKVCALFDIDPYSSISEGTLIVTCRPGKAGEVSRRLNDRGIRTTIVGEVLERSKGTTYFEGGRGHPLEHPKVDPFWGAFGKAAERR
jgi:hydrogenase maturation factor